MRAWASLLLASPRGAPVRVHALRALVAIAGALFLLPALVAPLVWAGGGGWMHPALVISVPLVGASGIGALLHAWRPHEPWGARVAIGAAVAALAVRGAWVITDERVRVDWPVLGALSAALVLGTLLLQWEARVAP